MTLLDDALPRYDVVERHRTDVRAPADVVYETVRHLDLSDSGLVRSLLALRYLPARLLGGDHGRRRLCRSTPWWPPAASSCSPSDRVRRSSSVWSGASGRRPAGCGR